MSKNEDSDNLTKVGINEEDISAFKESEYTRGEHPNSLKNLKPFPKGVSGNPLGRPHKYHKLADALLALADNKVTKQEWEGHGYVTVETNVTWREDVLKTIWSHARRGDIKFIQLLAYLGCLDG